MKIDEVEFGSRERESWELFVHLVFESWFSTLLPSPGHFPLEEKRIGNGEIESLSKPSSFDRPFPFFCLRLKSESSPSSISPSCGRSARGTKQTHQQKLALTTQQKMTKAATHCSGTSGVLLILGHAEGLQGMSLFVSLRGEAKKFQLSTRPISLDTAAKEARQEKKSLLKWRPAYTNTTIARIRGHDCNEWCWAKKRAKPGQKCHFVWFFHPSPWQNHAQMHDFRTATKSRHPVCLGRANLVFSVFSPTP